MQENKKRIIRSFSGIQPTGSLHLGNYLGAIKEWVSMSHEKTYENFFCIVDYHALNRLNFSNKDYSISKNTLNLIIDILSCGLNLENTFLFIQSWNSDHLELFWILNNFSYLGELERMTQFKEKVKNHYEKAIPMTLMNYPILQAADILLYKAEIIPVGEDQIQHIELTRRLASRFNNIKKIFPLPQAKLSGASRLLGLDGQFKMSKSLNNYIDFNESKKSLEKKIRSAKTDENRKRRNDPGNPFICNIFKYHKAFNSKENTDEIKNACQTAQIGCSDCKKNISDILWKLIEKNQEQKGIWLKKEKYIHEIVEESYKKAKKISSSTLYDVKKLLDLNYDFLKKE